MKYRKSNRYVDADAADLNKLALGLLICRQFAL